MDEREKRLPQYAKQLLSDLRRKVQFGNEPVIAEIARLRPQVELLKSRNEALTELLDCAATGKHKTAIEIMEILRNYDLTLTKKYQ